MRARPSNLPHHRFEPARQQVFVAVGMIAVALSVLAAFADRPFHMDDALYLQWGHRIARDVLDPYAGVTNWHGTAEPMVAAVRNPPLSGWFIAFAGWLFGWSERALHLLQLVPCAAYLTFTFLLARRWSASPLVALGIVATSSAFLISGATVMSDCSMAAFFVCAIFAWCRPPEVRMTILGITALTAAAMTKWYGLTLVPLLLAFEILSERKWTKRSALLSLPIVAACVVDRLVLQAHGVSLLNRAAEMATTEQGAEINGLMRSIVGLAFLGGACAAALLLIPVLAKAHLEICLIALVCAIGVTCAATTQLNAWPALANAPRANAWIISAQLGLLSGGGLLLLVLVLRQALEPNTESRFLALWTAGTFVFAVFVNWGILSRSFLPLVPAVGIAIARLLDQIPCARTQRGQVATSALLSLGGILGVLLLVSDTEVAREARTSASTLARASEGTPVWFQGHWGFQHYAEAAGALPMDRKQPAPAIGSLVVIPMLNTNVFGVDPERVETVRHESVELQSPILVLGPRSGAGFWSHTLGPLPFAWNLGDTSDTWVFRQTR